MRQQKREAVVFQEFEYTLNTNDIEKIVLIVLQRLNEAFAKQQGCKNDNHGRRDN